MAKELSDAQGRAQMVAEQLVRRGITDGRVLSVMGRLARELFLPADKVSSAYDDGPLAIGEGQTISQPYIVALMTESLQIQPGDSVLDVGTGSGYQTAILASLAERVYSIEVRTALAERAREVLDGLGYRNIEFCIGNGWAGWSDYREFDKIIVSAVSDDVPVGLLNQLKAGGKLVGPFRRGGAEKLLLVEKGVDNSTVETVLCYCRFVELVRPSRDDDFET